jgi:hypothetical protein
LSLATRRSSLKGTPVAQSFIGAQVAQKVEKVDFVQESKYRKVAARRREIKVDVRSEENCDRKEAELLIMYHGVDSRK